MKNKIIPYNPKLREYARELRNNSTKGEVLLWEGLKGSQLGVKFNRQFPILEYILDFYSKELKLGIEIDGFTHDYKISYDTKRTNDIMKWGVEIIRFSNDDVLNHCESVLRVIQEKVDDLKRTSPEPPSMGD